MDPDPGEFAVNPALCFLIRHSTRPETFVLDLGLHKDWRAHMPDYAERMRQVGADMSVPQDVAESLLKGRLNPADVNYVCISHIHIDHVGDPAPFSGAKFIVGSGARNLPDHTTGHTQEFSTKCFEAIPKERVDYLDLSSSPPIGPFAHAHDFYRDGSLYIVDAAGHLPGHVNILARTSPDGGWIYLAADTAHDWRIIKGERKIARKPLCIHADVEKAEAHIANVVRLMEGNKRVQVLLAHDIPWYEKNKGGDAFWPGEIPSL
ncbi:Metallo-hydrolase/oxidoreductase [Lentinus tigrinus ALCF2SS1-6]|uniref:Metallo-hydrolase/oxidoreductase n=1 Tax=Lentinus tigrinus ALCF2SS1-6 TaxID=1328759 RepID=A0A5C2SJC6_9APHY|nr:Metallo-hydrolase/oxidoreductase [Lentinus tigrinus ALCF2SS1-6]